VHVALDRRPLAVDGARCRRCLSCPSGISRARRVHEATGPSCRRSGRQPGSNEVRPGSKGCRDRHLRRNAADARRKSPHRDRRADLPPPTASRRVRPLVSLAPRSEPNLTFLTRWRARLGAPYHSIQRPARVCRIAGSGTSRCARRTFAAAALRTFRGGREQRTEPALHG
jgi:hypothetical protein